MGGGGKNASASASSPLAPAAPAARAAASGNSAGANDADVPDPLPTTGDVDVDRCTLDLTNAIADAFFYVDQTSPGRTVDGGPLQDRRSRSDFENGYIASLDDAKRAIPSSTQADYFKNLRLLNLLSAGATALQGLSNAPALELSNARDFAQRICVMGTRYNPPVVAMPARRVTVTGSGPAFTPSPRPVGGASAQGWNSLPHPHLDCSNIDYGGATEVAKVVERTLQGRDLTFVIRSCAVASGAAPQIVEVYEGTPSDPQAVGVLLSARDQATGVQIDFQGDAVLVRASTRLASDPNCCPSGNLSRRYVFTGETFEQSS